MREITIRVALLTAIATMTITLAGAPVGAAAPPHRDYGVAVPPAKCITVATSDKGNPFRSPRSCAPATGDSVSEVFQHHGG